MTNRASAPIVAALVLCVAGLLPAAARAEVDWSKWKADQAEEDAGGVSTLFVGPTDSLYGLAYGYAVRLRAFPALSSTLGPAIFYDSEAGAVFGAPLFMLRLTTPGWRVAPYVAAGGGYFFNPSDNSEDELLLDESDARAATHWAVHAEAGLRIRFGRTNQFVEIGALYRRPYQDLPEGVDADQIMGVLSLGVE